MAAIVEPNGGPTLPKLINNDDDNDSDYEYYDEYEDDNSQPKGLPQPTESYTYKPTQILANAMLPDNTDNNFPIKPPHPRPPPPAPSLPLSLSVTTDDNINDNDKKYYGTSDDYLNRQMITLMNALNIASHARPAMLQLGKSQKLTLIQQWSRQKSGDNQKPNLTNVKRQNKPKNIMNISLNIPLIPLLGKTISAPIITTQLSPASPKTTYSPKSNKLNVNNSSKMFSKSSHKLPMPTTVFDKPSKSYDDKNDNVYGHGHVGSKSSSVIPSIHQIQNKYNKSSKKRISAQYGPSLIKSVSAIPIIHVQKRVSVPPPVPLSIKQKYKNKSSHSRNGSKNSDNNIKFSDRKYDDVADDYYDYPDKLNIDLDEKKRTESVLEPIPPPKPKPWNRSRLKPKPVKSLKSSHSVRGAGTGSSTTNVKVKLRLGSKVEVFSNSKQQWIDGEIIKIKGKLLLLSYGKGKTQKWLEATSKSFRPKLQQIALAVSAQKISKSKSYNDVLGAGAGSGKKKSKSKNKFSSLLPFGGGSKGINDFDENNNPTPSRFRKSVAFQQKKQVKVKLRIGSPVEVYSVSNNKWVSGKLTGIKKNLLRVAYGKGYTTEKWLRSNSKQFRPKLEMVESAIHRKTIVSPPAAVSIPMPNIVNIPNKLVRQDSNGSDYSLGSDNEEDGHYIPDNKIFKPNYNNKPVPVPNNNPPPPPDDACPRGGYITHSLRREIYQQESIKTIKGYNSKRGDLKIKINGALQLRSSGNFVACKVAEHNLKTKKVSSDPNPVWKEVLKYSNFRPHIGKTALITVGNKSAIMGEKIIGTAEFELPIVFNRKEKLTVDITDKNNKLSGLVVLEQVVVESGR